MPPDSVQTNTEPTCGIFGILSSILGIFQYCKYRPRCRYFKISYIGSVFRYTDLRLVCFIGTYPRICNYDDILSTVLPRCMECRRCLAMRILSVRLFVCLSNACIVTERKKDPSRFFIPHERSFSLVFLKEWLVGGDPFYLKCWVNRPPLERNRRFSTDIRS